MFIQKIIPPVWMRIFILLQLIVDIAYPIMNLSFSYQVNLGIFILLFGQSISFIAAAKFRKEGVRVEPLVEDSTKLITDGSFKYSRNPMYLGMFVAMCGVSIALGSLSSVVPLILFYFLILFFFVQKEELAMAEQFGEEYANYQAKVRRWI